MVLVAKTWSVPRARHHHSHVSFCHPATVLSVSSHDPGSTHAHPLKCPPHFLAPYHHTMRPPPCMHGARTTTPPQRHQPQLSGLPALPHPRQRGHISAHGGSKSSAARTRNTASRYTSVSATAASPQPPQRHPHASSPRAFSPHLSYQTGFGSTPCRNAMPCALSSSAAAATSAGDRMHDSAVWVSRSTPRRRPPPTIPAICPVNPSS